MKREATPPKALLLVVFIYLAVSGLAASGRRYGFEEQAGPLGDCFYLLCGLLLAERNALKISSLQAAGTPGCGASAIFGILCGITVTAMLLWRFSAVVGFQFEAMTWGEIFHSVVAAPLSEELLLTGFLFPVLRSRFRLSTAALIVCLLFTLGHVPNSAPSFAIRFIYMFASCMLFERFRSLPLNIAMHCLANGLPVLVGHQPWLYLDQLPRTSEALPYVAAISEVTVVVLALRMGTPSLFRSRRSEQTATSERVVAKADCSVPHFFKRRHWMPDQVRHDRGCVASRRFQ